LNCFSNPLKISPVSPPDVLETAIPDGDYGKKATGVPLFDLPGWLFATFFAS
jgi:hypothetical protein